MSVFSGVFFWYNPVFDEVHGDSSHAGLGRKPQVPEAEFGGNRKHGLHPKTCSPMLSSLLLALPDGDTGMSHGGQPMGTAGMAAAGMLPTAGGLWEAAAQTQDHSWNICFSPVHKQPPVLGNGCEPSFLPQPNVLTPGRCPLIPRAVLQPWGDSPGGSLGVLAGVSESQGGLGVLGGVSPAHSP